MAQVAHLKGPEKDGVREPVYFASHVDYIEGLDDKLENEAKATLTKAGTVKLYDSTGNNTDGTMSQQAITNAINNIAPKLYASTGSNTDGAMTQQATTTAVNNAKTKLYSSTGYNTDGTMTQQAITNALSNNAGKLYNSTGNNTDGSMTQQAITNAINNNTAKLYSSTGSNTDGAMTQQAVTNALGSYVPKSAPTAFTLATSAWNENSSETSEFVYYADITVSGLTANDYAEVNFNRASQSIIAEANLCSSGETMSGKIRIYAENVPSSSISGEYIVTKGAV